MNTAQFIGYMSSPENLGKEAGALLNNLTREFPYFQTAQLLYVKSLHNESSFLYNNQLKIAAAYAANRRVLYELIKKKPEAPVAAEVKNEPLPEVITEIKTEELPAETETPITAPETEITPAAEEKQAEAPAYTTLRSKLKEDSGEWDESVIRQLQLLRHWQSDPQSGAPFILPRKEQPAEPVIEPIPTPEPELTPELTAEIIQETEIPAETVEPELPEPPAETVEVLTVVVETDEEDLEEAAEIPGEENLLSLTESETESGTEYEITPLVTEEPEPEHKPVEKPEDPVTQEILFKAIGSSIELEVSDEMPDISDLQPKTEPVSEPVAEQVPAETRKREEQDPALSDSPLSFAQWLKEVNRLALRQDTPTEEELKEETKNEAFSLIDKFIQNAPRITPQRTEFYNPVNMAKKSVTEDTEMVTETLARIYEKQGNIPKAIRAYQKLSLKYPEKSLYFASLIENLKKTPNKNTK